MSIQGRIDNNTFKRMVVEHAQIKARRDDLLADVELPTDMTANPMALMGLVSKMSDFKQAFDLSRQLEDISSQLIHEQIMRIADND